MLKCYSWQLLGKYFLMTLFDWKILTYWVLVMGTKSRIRNRLLKGYKGQALSDEYCLMYKGKTEVRFNN